jgi:hypothetical protein
MKCIDTQVRNTQFDSATIISFFTAKLISEISTTGFRTYPNHFCIFPNQLLTSQNQFATSPIQKGMPIFQISALTSQMSTLTSQMLALTNRLETFRKLFKKIK